MDDLTLFKIANTEEIAGLEKTILVDDETRQLAFYSVSPGVVAFGFYMTKGTFFPPGKDWLNNLRVWKKREAIGHEIYQAEDGFVLQYTSLRQMILDKIKVYQPTMIYLSGFSKGAAHATLCMRDLMGQFPRIKLDVTAFGSPRVYSMDSALEIDGDIQSSPLVRFRRICVSRDPVTKLPPCVFDYRHVGKQTVLGTPKHWFFSDVKVHDPVVYEAHLKAENCVES